MVFGNLLEQFKDLSMMYKVVAGLILVAALYYGYTWWFAPQPHLPMMPLPSSGDGNVAENYGNGELSCTMYYVDWCPHCKTAKPEWEQLTSEFDGKTVNGRKVLVTAVNCTDNDEIAEREGLKGYPTFKFNMDGKHFDYPDQPVFDKFKTFIEYIVGQQE
jgi:thiol-disulfide isomerase/thioredoxin